MAVKTAHPWGQALTFGCGLALMVLAVVSPIDAAAEEYLFSAHMLQHGLVGDSGIALVLLGLRGPLSVFRLAHDLQHACFVRGGALIWTQIIDPSRHARLTVAFRLHP